MKQINKYICDHFENDKFSIVERLHINKDTGNHRNHHYNYHPKTRIELKQIVDTLIDKRGNEANLNDIDTSEITDMTALFYYSSFNGDISEWDVSNVENMNHMFDTSKFTGKNGDISNWDASKVKSMGYMFYGSSFNGDISNWDVSKVEDMEFMFSKSKFTCENGDISNWDVSNVKNMNHMFYGSSFTGENGDISKWNVSNVEDMSSMFKNSKFKGDISNWNVSNVKYMNDIFKYSPLQLKRNQSKRCKIIL